MKNEDNTKSAISTIHMTQRFLALIDANKDKPSVTLKEILDDFEKLYSDKEYFQTFYFNNQYFMLTALWAYIVLPNESFFNNLPNGEIKDLSGKWGLGKQDSTVKSKTLKEFIRKMRNSIAHTNIEFDENLNFTFSDKPPGTLEIKFTGEDLIKFSKAISWWAMTGDVSLKNL